MESGYKQEIFCYDTHCHHKDSFVAMEKGQNGNEFECDGVPETYWCQEWKKLVLRFPGLIFDLDTGVRVHGVLERVILVARIPIGTVLKDWDEPQTAGQLE